MFPSASSKFRRTYLFLIAIACLLVAATLSTSEMPFGQRLDQLVGKVKGQVDKYANEHAAQKQQQQQAGYPGSTPYQRPPPPPPPAHSGPGPEVYWNASFDAATPVSAQFKHQTGDWGWGNNELQNYTPQPTNSLHHPQNHTLLLRAIANSTHPTPNQRYTSARLTSHQTLARSRGYLSVRLSPPVARGIWPAFWLLPREPFSWPTEGEVDIFESWNADGINHSCLHWGQFTGEDAQKHRAIETNIGARELGREGGHRFGFAWSQEGGQEGRMVWYINDRAVMKAGIPAGTRPMADWQIIINVAMGGNVCQGVVPADGEYEMAIHELKLVEAPPGGWGRFDGDWNGAPEGHTM